MVFSRINLTANDPAHNVEMIMPEIKAAPVIKII
jgi:hypothetical protein